MLWTILNIGCDIVQILPVCIPEGISLLRDSEGTHLKPRVRKNPDKTLPDLLFFHSGSNRFAKGTDNFLLSTSIHMQRYTKREVIKRLIDFVCHIIIKSFDAGYSFI